MAKYGLDLFLLVGGIMCLITGLVGYARFRSDKKKYSIETLATITSYYRIRRYENTAHESIYQKLTLRLDVESKEQQVTKEMGRQVLGRGGKEDFLLIKNENLYLKRLDPLTQKNTIVGKEIKIYFNPNDPNDLYLNLDNEIKTTNILIYIALSIGSLLFISGLCVFIKMFL